MTERPILFSAPMVRALLDGRKTQTRRVVKPRHDWHVDEVPDERGVSRPWPVFEAYVYAVPETVEVPCPYGEPGDRLWVKETWRTERAFNAVAPAKVPRGSCIQHAEEEPEPNHGIYGKTRPSIFMMRWMSRITLEVTGVRVERLQDITEADAIAEGVKPFFEEYSGIGPDQRITSGERAADAPFRASYAVLWDSINGAKLWAANPWVWVVEFKRVTP